MKPDPARFLEVAAAHLLVRTAPALPSGYEQSSLQVLAAMLMAVREEFDRAASRRVEENAALRGLFARATPAVEDAALAARLAEAAAGADADLSVPALEAANAALRALLVELHGHVESLDSEAARALEDAIWRELARSTERRRLALGPF